MATGHLVTHAHLALLGHIDLGHLDDAGGKLVTNGDGELATLQFCIKQLILLDEVDNELGDEAVDVFVAGPANELNAGVVQTGKVGLGELGTLLDDLGTHVVFDTLRGQVLGEFQ